MLLKRIWRKARRVIQPSNAGSMQQLDNGTLLMPGYRVDVRAMPVDNRVRIGSNTVLECQIVLERKSGLVTIGSDTFIGGSKIICACNITIGSHVLIAWGCTFVDHDAHSVYWSERCNDAQSWRAGLLHGGSKSSEFKNWDVVPMAPITVQDKVWIGFNTIILKGVTIGEGAVIGAGSVVTKDIPAWTMAAGNPARIIKEVPQVSEEMVNDKNET